jgi:hypothetical protein
VTVFAAAATILGIRKLDGSRKYEHNFAPSAAAAIGAFALAGGITVAVIFGWNTWTKLELIRNVCGLLAVPALVALGLFRMPKPDEWCVNVSRITGIDATDPESLTKAEIEGRKQVQMIFNMIRKYVPGCENAKIKASGSHVGVRETRHIAGDYRLVAEDLLQGKVPEDAILLAANSVDVHGRFGPASNEYTPISGDYYGVPYRSLIAKGVKNLLLAGRNVSADSTAAGAIRVMPPCMGMGQASGTAAALAVKKGITPREVDAQELRAVLKANGAHL